MVCGVYGIRNTINDKTYIGKSIDIKKRWRSELSGLRRKDSSKINSHLINAWHKYGEKIFVFEVLHTCAPSELDLMEAKSILSTPTEKRYNFRVPGNDVAAWVEKSKSPRLGTKHSEKTKALMSKIQKDKIAANPEIKDKLRKMSKDYLDNNPNPFLGKVHTELTKETIRNKNKARYKSDKELRDKVNAASRKFWGDKENKAKAMPKLLQNLRKSHIANSKSVIRIDLVSGKEMEYCSISDAGRKNNLRGDKISLVCNGKRKTHGGFRWKFKS